jgi:hypothetical protein
MTLQTGGKVALHVRGRALLTTRKQQEGRFNNHKKPCGSSAATRAGSITRWLQSHQDKDETRKR